MADSLKKGLINKGIVYLERSACRIPDLADFSQWMRRMLLLGDFYWIKNEMKQSTVVYQRIEQVRREIFEKHQLDYLDMFFISAFRANNSVRIHEFLETYIYLGLLGMHSNDKKLFLFLSPEVQVNDPCLLKYLSKYVTITSDLQTIELLRPLVGL